MFATISFASLRKLNERTFKFLSVCRQVSMPSIEHNKHVKKNSKDGAGILRQGRSPGKETP